MREVNSCWRKGKRGALSILKRAKTNIPLKLPSSSSLLSKIKERIQGIGSFRLPFTSEKKKVSISIEGTTLRIIACEGKRITKWANLPFNPTLLRNGFIANPKDMSQVIKNALNGKDLKQKKVIVALPGFQSLSRIITLPRARDVNPKVVIPREAIRLMPVSMENSSIFWQALKKEKTQQSFFVLAVPKQPLLRLVETIRLAGLKPSKVDIAPLALARAVNQSDAIIANAENNGIDIVIVRDHIPYVMRSVFSGEETIPLESLAPRVVEELGINIGYYNDNNRDNPLPSNLPVYLCGACAIDPDLPSMVQREIGYPVGELKSTLRTPRDFPTAQMMVNIGLILKEL